MRGFSHPFFSTILPPHNMSPLHSSPEQHCEHHQHGLPSLQFKIARKNSRANLHHRGSPVFSMPKPVLWAYLDGQNFGGRYDTPQPKTESRGRKTHPAVSTYETAIGTRSPTRGRQRQAKKPCQEEARRLDIAPRCAQYCAVAQTNATWFSSQNCKRRTHRHPWRFFIVRTPLRASFGRAIAGRLRPAGFLCHRSANPAFCPPSPFSSGTRDQPDKGGRHGQTLARPSRTNRIPRPYPSFRRCPRACRHAAARQHRPYLAAGRAPRSALASPAGAR